MKTYISKRLGDFKRELENTTDEMHQNYLEGIIDAHEHLLAVAEKNSAWVTVGGEYGQGMFKAFPPEDLTDDQWDDIVNMSEGSRYNYVSAILSGDTSWANQIREDNFGDD